MKKICFASCIAIFVCSSQVFGSEAGMPQLNPEFWGAQVFWLILIFSSLYFIIGKIYLPKITLTIENRKSKLVNDLNEAQKLKESAEKKLKEYEQIIENSKKDAKKIIDDAKKKLDQDIENKKNQFSSEIEKEISTAEKEIENLKKSSINSINKIASDTSGEIIKKIVDTEINNSSVSAIVNDIIKKENEKYI